MDAVAAPQLPARDQFKVPDPEVGAVAVPEGDDVTARHGSAVALPEQDVAEPPVEARRHGVVVGHLDLAVALGVDDHGSDRHPGVRDLPGLELRLGRAAAGADLLAGVPAVRGMAGPEAMRDAHLVAAAQPAGVRGSQVGRALAEAQVTRLGIDHLELPTEEARQVLRRQVGVEPPELALLERGPGPAGHRLPPGRTCTVPRRCTRSMALSPRCSAPTR